MYYIVYAIFYLLSLLPWWIMYFLSDAIYGLVYYVIGYRKDVVMKNLLIAFPEKSVEERKKIAKEFYHGLIDTFVEVIKLLSISEKGLKKRFSSNIGVVNELFDKNINVQLHAGHFFSWEVINLGISRYGRYPFVGVYMPVSNKVFDRIMINVRGRFGTILVPAVNFKENFRQMIKGRYSLGLAADQNPGKPANAYWVPFFGRLTPFVTGPEKGAKINNTAVVFVNFYRVKRGHYHCEFDIMTVTPNDYPDGQLTKAFAKRVEDAIRERPSNYLWSHRRWKWEFDEAKYGDKVVR